MVSSAAAALCKGRRSTVPMELYEQIPIFGLPIHIGPGFFGLMLAFCRITGLFFSMPLFSMRTVPKTVRIGLSFLVAIVVSPLVAVDPAAVTWDGPRLAYLMISEILLGLGMGLAGAVALSLLEVTGTFAGMNAGLAVAQQFDPVTMSQQLITTRLVQTLGFMAFLALDMHHLMFLGLVDSFVIAPPGAGVLHAAAGPGLAEFAGGILLDAMRITMPVVVAVMFLNLLAALVTRFAQQMNIYFSVGLPANAVAGLFAISLGMPALLATMIATVGEMRGLMISVVGGG